MRVSHNRIYIILILLISLIIRPNDINSHGHYGGLTTPSASTFKESSLALHFSRFEPDRKFVLTASPFDWLDASIFYVDIVSLDYNNGFDQTYKDKGFNLKIRLLEERQNLPSISIGLNDLAGTGIYSSEYIVASKKYNKFETSVGLMWSPNISGKSIRNPFISINDSFRNRSLVPKDKGGSLDFNNYFSGEKVAPFFLVKYQATPNANFFIEYDPLNFPDQYNSEKYNWDLERKNNINYGVQINMKQFDASFAVVSNEQLMFNISKKFNFSDYKANSFIETKKSASFKELQNNLALNDIGLIEASRKDTALILKVKQNSYPNQLEANKNIQKIVQNHEFKNDYKTLIIRQYTLGMEVMGTESNIKNGNHFEEKTSLTASTEKLYEVTNDMPILRSNNQIRIRTMLASREGFLFNGILLENDTELIFSENLIFLSNIKYPIFSNFDRLYIPPVDTYPNQVRSDVKEYLKKIGSGFSIGRFEINYFKAFKRKHFFRLSAGLFEEMFSGAGIDYLYSRQYSNLVFGAQAYHVKKRDYNLYFSSLDYSNEFLRVFAEVTHPQTKIKLKLSYGEYLAGDIGTTLEIKRRFNNGVEFGVFATNTDVPVELFGEGSFDKGIKLKIPLNFFGKSKNLISYEWRPLTKDPGQQLIRSVNIEDVIERYRVR